MLKDSGRRGTCRQSPHLGRTFAFVAVLSSTFWGGGCGGTSTGTNTTDTDGTGSDVGTADGANANSTTGTSGGKTSEAQATATSSSTTMGVRSDGPLVAANAAGYYEVPLNGCMLGEYFASTRVGNANLNLLIDSGSTTMAVASSTCSSCTTADKYSVSGKTPTSNRAVASAYGSADDPVGWSGYIYKDDVRMTTSQGSSTPAAQLSFVAITQSTNFFGSVGSCSSTAAADFDGILGIGPDDTALTGTSSFVKVLRDANQLAYNAVGLQTCHVGGTLSLGGYANDLVAERPVYFPKMVGNFADETQDYPYGYYSTLNLRSVAVGDKVLSLPSKALGSTIVDNGTNFSLFTNALYTALCAGLQANANFTANFPQLYTGDSSIDVAESALGLSMEQLDAALPPLVLSFAQDGSAIGSISLPATKSYLAPLNAGGTVVYAESILGTQAAGDVVGARMLGNSLMRAHTIIDDRDGARLGFAAQGQGCSDVLPTYYE